MKKLSVVHAPASSTMSAQGSNGLAKESKAKAKEEQQEEAMA